MIEHTATDVPIATATFDRRAYSIGIVDPPIARFTEQELHSE